jgi:hypothetical protein
VYGGAPKRSQIMDLERGVHVVVLFKLCFALVALAHHMQRFPARQERFGSNNNGH